VTGHHGGGSATFTVGPDPNGKDVNVPVALSAIPARCDGYGVALS
jgi:hypothetical protein